MWVRLPSRVWRCEFGGRPRLVEGETLKKERDLQMLQKQISYVYWKLHRTIRCIGPNSLTTTTNAIISYLLFSPSDALEFVQFALCLLYIFLKLVSATFVCPGRRRKSRSLRHYRFVSLEPNRNYQNEVFLTSRQFPPSSHVPCIFRSLDQ